MTHSQMFDNAKWICESGQGAIGSGSSNPLMRAEFEAAGDEKAVLTICGLGFFELYCNGTKINSDLLVPAWSDYEPHTFLHDGKPINETRGHRVWVMQYDISEFILQGNNVLGIALGGGWYDRFEYGKVKACFKLELSSGYTKRLVLSDTNVKCAPSPIVKSVMLRGETHDYNNAVDNWASVDFDDSKWEQVQEIAPPESDFLIQTCPPDKITRYITPTLLSENNGIRIYDTGENIAGYAVISCKNDILGEITVTYAEELSSNGELDCSTYNYNMPELIHIDRFILDGKKRALYPHFLWHGFRYFSVEEAAPTTAITAITVAVTNSDTPVTSSFDCDNSDLNWLYDAYVRTQLANMHAGIPSDCPHREGQGYTGDGQLTCDAVMTMFDAKEFYRKWLYDISDCQCRESGHIQYVAPYTPCGGGPGGWGCAIIVVPLTFYKHYGDKDLLRQFYPQMRHYLEYMENHSDNDLVTREDPSWAWCLGDWCTPDKVEIPEPFVNTYFYIKSLEQIIEIAEILGIEKDISDYKKLIEIKKQAITSKYYDKSSCSFAQGVQGADAFAVDIGLGNEVTWQNVINKYKALAMFDTGIFGTDILLRLLFERGQGQLGYDLLANKNKVSFHSMRMNGATTLYEYWDGDKSHNHPMFGSSTRYLFSYLLGIRQNDNSLDLNNYIINPVFVDGLNYARGFITTAKGKIEASFVKNHEGISFTATIPDGIHAEFVSDTRSVKLQGGKNEIFIGL